MIDANHLKIKKKKTARGFRLATFKDFYGAKCSIQESSLAEYDCYWLGIDDPEPKVMASEAAKVGVKTEQKTGWVDYPIPDNVLLSTRMHLTRDQVIDLIDALQEFIGEV